MVYQPGHRYRVMRLSHRSHSRPSSAQSFHDAAPTAGRPLVAWLLGQRRRGRARAGAGVFGAGLVIEQDFQFIWAFGHQWSFTMHQNLHDCTLSATAEDTPIMSDVQVGLV